MGRKMYATIKDYRTGTFLQLSGVATPNGKYWTVEYAGGYGYEEDPGPVHSDSFHTLEDAMPRYQELVMMYHTDALNVNRLKAFKKAWVPPFDNKRHSANDEALIFHRNVMMAIMTSQGPTARTKRTWVVSNTLFTDITTLSAGTYSRMLIPKERATGPLEANARVIEPGRMNDAVRQLWDATLKLYRTAIA